MGTTVEGLLVEIEAKEGELTLKRLEGRLAGTGRASKRLEERTKRLNRSFVLTAGGSARLARSLQRQVAAVGSLALGYFSLQGAMAAVRSIVGTGAGFEQLSASLETVTGSAEAAKQVFDAILSFATKTPFEVDNITSAYINLRNVGILPTKEILTAFGDIASANGRSILDFSQAVATATTNNFDSLKSFGILASSEGDRVKIVFRGTETSVKKDAESIVSHLVEIGQTEFAGGMERQSRTLRGRLSNLSDAWSQFADRVFKSGLDQKLKATTDQLIRLLSQNPRAAAGLGSLLSNLAETALLAARGVAWLASRYHLFAAAVTSSAASVISAVTKMDQVSRRFVASFLKTTEAQIGHLRTLAVVAAAITAPFTDQAEATGRFFDQLQSGVSGYRQELERSSSEAARSSGLIVESLREVADEHKELYLESGRTTERLGDFTAGTSGAGAGAVSLAEKISQLRGRLSQIRGELGDTVRELSGMANQLGAEQELLDLARASDALFATMTGNARQLVTALDIAQKAIELGVEPALVRTDERVRLLLREIILKERIMQVEVQLEVVGAERIEEGVGAVLDRLQSQVPAQVERTLDALPPIDPDVFLPGDEDFDRMSAELRRSIEDGVRPAAGFAAAVLTGALADIGAGGQDVFRNLWNSFLDLGYQAIEQILHRWATARFADKAVNLTSSGGGLDGATGAASAGVGTFSTFAAVAAVYTAVFDYFESRADRIAAERFGSQVQLQYGQGIIVGGAHTGFEEDVRAPLSRAADAARETLRELLAAIGGFVDQIPRFAVEVQNGGELFRATVEGSVTGLFEEIGVFRSYEEALQAAMLEAIRRAEFQDLGENVALLLERSLTNNLDRFNADLQLAQFLDRAGLNETQVWVQEFLGRASSVISRVREIGLSLADAERALLLEAAARRRNIEATLEAALGYDDSVDRILAAREAALAFNEGAGQLEESLMRAREQAQQLADSPGLGTSGDHVEDFQDTTDRLGTSLDELGRDFDIFEDGAHKARKEVEDLNGAVERIDLSHIEEALRAVADDQLGAVTDRLVALLRPLGHSAELQEVIALREQARLVAELRGIDQQIASIRLLQAETGALTALQLRHLNLLEGLRERLGELFESGALTNIPRPSGSISTGGGGFLGSVQARQARRLELQRELGILEERLAGTYAEAGVRVRESLAELREELRRLGGLSEEFKERLLGARLEAELQAFLAPFQETLTASREDPFQTRLRQFDAGTEEAIRALQAMGLSASREAQAIDVVTRARELERQAIVAERDALREETAARQEEQRVARESRLEDLAASIEDLRQATNLSVGDIQARREDLVAAFAEMGVSSRELIHDINEAAAAATEGSGLSFLERTLNRLGIVSPEVTIALLELERAETLATLTTYQLAGAFDNLADFDFQATFGQISDAYQALIDAANRPPPRLPPVAPAPEPVAGPSELDLVLGDIASWVLQLQDAQLSPLDQQLVGLDRRLASIVERLIAAGGSLSQVAELEQLLAAERERLISQAYDPIRDGLAALDASDPRLSPHQQVQRAEQEYQRLLALAQGGDLSVLQDLRRAGDLYIAARQDYLGGGVGSNLVRDEVRSAYQALLVNAGLGPGTGDIQADQLNVQHQMLDQLRLLNGQAALRPAGGDGAFAPPLAPAVETRVFQPAPFVPPVFVPAAPQPAQELALSLRPPEAEAELAEALQGLTRGRAAADQEQAEQGEQLVALMSELLATLHRMESRSRGRSGGVELL